MVALAENYENDVFTASFSVNSASCGGKVQIDLLGVDRIEPRECPENATNWTNEFNGYIITYNEAKAIPVAGYEQKESLIEKISTAFSLRSNVGIRDFLRKSDEVVQYLLIAAADQIMKIISGVKLSLDVVSDPEYKDVNVLLIIICSTLDPIEINDKIDEMFDSEWFKRLELTGINLSILPEFE